MHDRFDQEFYRCQWQRVLPLGPDGIQPYVHAGRSPVLPAAASAVRRALAAFAGLGSSAIAFWRQAAIGIAPPAGGAASRTRCC